MTVWRATGNNCAYAPSRVIVQRLLGLPVPQGVVLVAFTTGRLGGLLMYFRLAAKSVYNLPDRSRKAHTRQHINSRNQSNSFEAHIDIYREYCNWRGSRVKYDAKLFLVDTAKLPPDRWLARRKSGKSASVSPWAAL